MKRTPLVLALALCSFAGLALSLGQASADGPKPCKATKFDFPQVKAACDAGGVDAAKKLMKSVVDKAKAAGKEVNCNACHKDLKEYALTPNAVADLKPLM